MIIRTLLFVLLSLFLASVTLAQASSNGVTLFGKMHDAESKTALPNLSLQLLTEKDSAFVAGRLTNDAGAFTFTGLKKGVYVLVARSMGYRPIRQQVLIGELSAFLDLGVLLMIKETQRLGDIVVSADPTTDGVSAAMDKKTITVADNISQAGGSVLAAMSTVPGVTIGPDGKVLVRGSDKVVVLIDGKQTALTGFGSQNGLDNLPASALERIEIINNPSARFDANASAGIINLIFKKEEQKGFNGKLGLVAGAGALWVKRKISRRFVRSTSVRPSSIRLCQSTTAMARRIRSCKVTGCIRQRSTRMNSQREHMMTARSSFSKSSETGAPTMQR